MTSSTQGWLGYSRRHCIQALSAQNIDSISFGHWLAIPSQQMLLIFRNQQCVAIDQQVLSSDRTNLSAA